MDVILKVTVLFTLVLALAFLIERLLEILKAIYDLLDSRFNWHGFWTKRAAKIAKKLEQKLKTFEYARHQQVVRVFNRFQSLLLNKKDHPDHEFPVLSGDLVRSISISVISKVLGMAFGVALAFWMKLDLIIIWQGGAGEKAVWDIMIQSQSLRWVITGIIMGLGAGPVHQFIRLIEKKRKFRVQTGV